MKYFKFLPSTQIDGLKIELNEGQSHTSDSQKCFSDF